MKVLFSLLLFGLLSAQPSDDEIVNHPSAELLLFIKNGKRGFVNREKKVVIPPIYDWLSHFEKNGLAWAVKDSKQGKINKKGEEIIPIKFDKIMVRQTGLLRVELNKKVGFYEDSASGRLIFPPKYDEVSNFYGGLARVTLGKTEGVVNLNGKEIISAKYESIGFSNGLGFFQDGLARVRLANKYGFVDNTGKITIPIKYENATLFSEGLAGVKLNGNAGFGR